MRLRQSLREEFDDTRNRTQTLENHAQANIRRAMGSTILICLGLPQTIQLSMHPRENPLQYVGFDMTAVGIGTSGLCLALAITQRVKSHTAWRRYEAREAAEFVEITRNYHEAILQTAVSSTDVPPEPAKENDWFFDSLYDNVNEDLE